MKNFFKKLKRNKRGFTLLECVVAIAIIGIMCSSMLVLFQQGFTFVSKSQKLDQASADAAGILATERDSIDDESSKSYYIDGLPITVEFDIDDGSTRLTPKDHDFRAGIVINDGKDIKVVYYDISENEDEE